MVPSALVWTGAESEAHRMRLVMIIIGADREVGMRPA
jgi:hypothetical protein